MVNFLLFITFFLFPLSPPFYALHLTAVAGVARHRKFKCPVKIDVWTFPHLLLTSHYDVPVLSVYACTFHAYHHACARFPQTFWCRNLGFVTTMLEWICHVSRLDIGKYVFNFPPDVRLARKLWLKPNSSLRAPENVERSYCCYCNYHYFCPLSRPTTVEWSAVNICINTGTLIDESTFPSGLIIQFPHLFIVHM